ncbi:Ran BP2/NZF zinc finger-like superfamily protein [Actinidia rufa]|uniref:Ran BP2/NZF zinc finger-like superfamily protein n=1 Tax=Actinidia rufa TaxID=165716 RepID=A0A7J0DSG5_9ERIC|nr:Ran BP2/NZF zinc finger-like superfamily protein [Actinidia rufa]
METGFAVHANTRTLKIAICAKDVASPSLEVGPMYHLMEETGLKCYRVIGTAMSYPVEHTTTLADQVAIGVVHAKMYMMMVVVSPGGRPGIGFALGLDAVHTTMLAEWNVSSVDHQELSKETTYIMILI